MHPHQMPAFVSYWLQLWFLLPGCFMLETGRPVWMSKTNVCDVNVVQKTNDIIFYCDRRKLRNVPIEVSSNATVLYLSQNKIRNISETAFHDLTELRYLYATLLNSGGEVYIAEGSFSKMTNLVSLNLDSNVLRHIPDKLPPGLRILSLKKNKIWTVLQNSFSGLKNITEIQLSFNCFAWMPCNTNIVIERDAFRNLTNLHILSLAYNNLTRVPHKLPNSLETLDLSGNSIQRITEDDFKELTNLQVLDLQGNCPRCHNAPYPCISCPNESIEIHPNAFSNLIYLDTLQLAGNSLRYINNSWFENLTNLRQLFLSFNFLTHVIAADGGFLTHLSHLEKIDLSYNYELKAYPETLSLSGNFSKLVALKYIHIEGYVFKEIQKATLEPLYNLKNLSILNFGTNFIVNTEPFVFQNFHNLKVIYLAENRLYPVVVNTKASYGTGTSYNSLSPMSTPENYDYVSRLLIKQACYNSGRVLDLSSNNIFFISPMQFEGFGDIACLNLSNNGFTAALNGTEFNSLPNLKYLDLSQNKIDLAYDTAFRELKKLEVLDLSSNSHYFTISGVTHNLNFSENLPELKVLNLSQNKIFTLTTKHLRSKSLVELQFQGNCLNKLWKDHSYYKIFKDLVNLTILDISYNELENIPCEVYENLPRTITTLHLHHNSLKVFEWDKLINFTKLTILDLSFNSLTHVSENISAITQSLKVLNLKHNKISHLSDGFINNAKTLDVLFLSNNMLTVVNKSTFISGPTSHVKHLHLDGNPFLCNCDNFEFILWLKSRNINISYLSTKVNCHMPQQLKDKAVINFDIGQCVNDEEASLICTLSAMFVFWFVVIAVTMHLFYWDASYIFHYWKAKMKGYNHLHSTGNVYDAFITYDTKDPYVSEWVLNHLRVQLEEKGEKILPVCLEERDWDPGSPVIDNLSQSIWQSRKTVFVLTESYVQSGAFRMAAYLAHQRLLDHNMDVIVLLLLEPVLQHSQFLRLRRRLCSKTVLEWPRNPSAEQWFWQCLRSAIRMDNQVMYSKLFSRYFPMR